MKWKGKFFKLLHCDKFLESIVCKLHGNLKFKIKILTILKKKIEHEFTKIHVQYTMVVCSSLNQWVAFPSLSSNLFN